MTKQLLTASAVEAILDECLFRVGEDTSDPAVGNGVVCDFGFHRERLNARKADILALLHELPEQFQVDSGGGWSFLNACVTKDGSHWGEHRNIEQLMALGIASEQASLLLPRELWAALPGGMPYFCVTIPLAASSTAASRA